MDNHAPVRVPLLMLAACFLAKHRNRLIAVGSVLFAAILLAACPRAQVVRIENLAPTAFSGWKRVTVDQAPPHQVGRVGDTLFVAGRQVGIDTRVVDVRIDLAPGAKLSIDLASATPATWTLGGLPSAPTTWFGGWATVAGTPLQIVSLVPDGAGWLVHMRARPTPAEPMLCANLWMVWYPDTPGWARGEVLVTASNPAVPAMSAVIPDGFDLRSEALSSRCRAVLDRCWHPGPCSPMASLARCRSCSCGLHGCRASRTSGRSSRMRRSASPAWACRGCWRTATRPTRPDSIHAPGPRRNSLRPCSGCTRGSLLCAVRRPEA